MKKTLRTKHYEEKLWDYLAKSLLKEDARKVWHYITKANDTLLLNYMADLEDKYKQELKLRPDSSLIDDFAFGIAIAKEIKNMFTPPRVDNNNKE